MKLSLQNLLIFVMNKHFFKIMQIFWLGIGQQKVLARSS